MITIDTATTGIAFRANDTGNVHTAYFLNTSDQSKFMRETLPQVGTLLGLIVRLSADQFTYSFTRRGQNFSRLVTSPDAVTELAKAISELPR